MDEDQILFIITKKQNKQDLFAEPWSPLAPPSAGKLSCSFMPQADPLKAEVCFVVSA